jgi:hypothetical protein
MSIQSGLMNRVPSMKMLPAIRQPFDVHMHHHHPVPVGFMQKRLGTAPANGNMHKVTWNFYLPRVRWEAVCEHSDVVFYAAAVPEDLEFRKGRTYDNCDGPTHS